ncbi:AAA family ATPase [Pseudohoeflea coraliihabitans]|uniref:AAA family ATPase n=1 Tax=Pseudohoeflea coraliihabitans TaxID=2860393 RepID=A0ABS6WMF9_9HYPH|nr:AAA family ATPase [Pseudohoeflea sp. DP4N28-3]MBW3097146.1 AAA family ATPase [Pseudohoeflea sp. DP4N28-3]
MATIETIRTLSGVGILADKAARENIPPFRRYNLVYGFNGSGKSTLSRVFACLEAGKHHKDLPTNCSFEIALDDGATFKAPNALEGLESRICVFNEDFIARNLWWQEGRASSIFYISEEQSDLAAELREFRTTLTEKVRLRETEKKIVAERERTLKSYRTERAKLVAASLHLGNRRYEAGQLEKDYEKLSYNKGSQLEKEDLDLLVDVARLSAPPPALKPIAIDFDGVRKTMEGARHFAELSIGTMVLDEMENHPSMVPWLKTGHDYHSVNGLESCLLCGSSISDVRKKKLAEALDDRLSMLISDLQEANMKASVLLSRIMSAAGVWPKTAEIELQLRGRYTAACHNTENALLGLISLLEEASRIFTARLEQPTTAVAHTLPAREEIATLCKALEDAIAVQNAVVGEHNDTFENFSKRQEDAREAIRKHYLAEGHDKYKELMQSLARANKTVSFISEEINKLEGAIAELSGKVRTHGPAADRITKLIRAYLGHGELTIFAAAEGYELRRRDKIVKGAPSEGEKTAIALCYFISSLEADGRSLTDLILVIDDPISSLDTKAMNFACSLIRSRLSSAAQLFILTHNQHCMNEFKKGWRNQTKAEPPTATLLYLDVSMPDGSEARSTRIIGLPPHLSAYDSEYHFLCHKVLQFEASGSGYSEYWFMMPNVMRRVLEIFLAFKVPGSHPLQQKLESLAKKCLGIDEVRIKALERLIQVESHSDSLDDLISHSSMTIEETRDANAALLELMAASDADHTKAIRRQCKAIS